MYEQNLPYIQRREEMRKKAEKEGREFIDDGPVRMHVPMLLHQLPEEWAVLVGGYKNPETARKALDVVHKWKPPTDETLMDKVTAMNQPGLAEG